MHPLLGQASAVALRLRPWRALPKSPAAVGALLLRFNSTPLPRTLTRIPTPLSTMCLCCRQTRNYSSAAVSAKQQKDPNSKRSKKLLKKIEKRKDKIRKKRKRRITKKIRLEEKMGIPPRRRRRRRRRRTQPLNILFCGSDRFSCAALEAIYQEHKLRPRFIQSIEVVTRPGKLTGRGYKQVQHTEIKALAEKLGLPVHERNTFTGWDMPPNINLIIAVSFGLFVPPRLLNQALYGGLNVHPSFLPDLYGPAPIEHTILAGRRITGVSLQTLDPEKFDAGRILARSDIIRIPDTWHAPTLLARITPVAADLLLHGIRKKLHVPPLQDAAPTQAVLEYWRRIGRMQGKKKKDIEYLHAHKLTSADRQLRPEHVSRMHRRFLALGPLWFYSRDASGAQKRIIIGHVSRDPHADPNPTAESLFVAHFEPDSGTVRPQQRFAVPFELDPEPKTPASTKPAEPASQDPQNNGGESNFVFWVPKKPKGTPKDDNADGPVYLDKFRIDTMKVEGQTVMPATRALKRFWVPIPDEEEE